MSPRIVFSLLSAALLLSGTAQAQQHSNSTVRTAAPAPMHAATAHVHTAVPGAATGPWAIRPATGSGQFHTGPNGFNHCGSNPNNCRSHHVPNQGYAYGYYPIYGYPYYGQAYADNSAPEQPVNYEENENAAVNAPNEQATAQLDHLTYEVEQLRADQQSARQNQGDQNYSTAKDLGSITPTVLVFADGHQMQINNYALVGHTVWVLSDHAATQKIPLAQLDVVATVKANEQNGVEFVVP